MTANAVTVCVDCSARRAEPRIWGPAQWNMFGELVSCVTCQPVSPGETDVQPWLGVKLRPAMSNTRDRFVQIGVPNPCRSMGPFVRTRPNENR